MCCIHTAYYFSFLVVHVCRHRHQTLILRLVHTNLSINLHSPDFVRVIQLEMCVTKQLGETIAHCYTFYFYIPKIIRSFDIFEIRKYIDAERHSKKPAGCGEKEKSHSHRVKNKTKGKQQTIICCAIYYVIMRCIMPGPNDILNASNEV